MADCGAKRGTEQLACNTYISTDEVLLVLYDAPGSDTDGTYLPSGLRGVVLQGIPHVTNHTYRTEEEQQLRTRGHNQKDEPE